ncbi:MAG TPA: hypothetical protein VI756_07110, partial [Blastocatellia bacterium]
MTTYAADPFKSLSKVPSGGRLILYDVGWDDYEELIERFGDSSSLRISYDGGRLEAMSPSTLHEKYKNLINRMVVLLCDEL